MDDFERLEKLTLSLDRARQDYWRAEEHEKPRVAILALRVFLFSLAVSSFFVFFNPALLKNGFFLTFFIFQIGCLAFSGGRLCSYKLSKRQLDQAVVKTNEEIVSINREHFFRLLEEIRDSFPPSEKEFGEFLCCMSAFFSLDSYRSYASPEKKYFSLTDSWKMPEGTALRQAGERILRTRTLGAVPERQKLGILAIMRKNMEHITGREEKDKAAVDASNQNAFLIRRLMKEPPFTDRFAELIGRFIEEQ